MPDTPLPSQAERQELVTRLSQFRESLPDTQQKILDTMIAAESAPPQENAAAVEGYNWYSAGWHGPGWYDARAAVRWENTAWDWHWGRSRIW